MTEKNKTVTLLLCIIVGYLGIHRFYVGKTKTGILYLLTGGLCGIGWIIDIVLICTDKFSGVAKPQNISSVQYAHPQATQSQASQPRATQLQVAQSQAPQPRVTQPQVAQSQAPQPRITQPQAAQSQVSQPQTTQSPIVQSQVAQPQTAPLSSGIQTPQQSATHKPMPHFLPITDGKGLKYKYENDLCMIDITAEQLNAELGGMISFKQEPENPNDNKAVAIWQNNRKLGYIYQGQIQEMANRWINNADPLIGFISSIDIQKNKIKYKIGFYKPLDAMQKQKFKLTGIRQKDALGDLRQDNLELCNVGETLEIELDDDGENETYIVWGSAGEIGTLPKKAENFLGSKRSAIGILTMVNCDENDKYTAEVDVYI